MGTFLERHANDVAAKLPVPEASWAGRVRDVLMKRAADAPQAGDVAKALAVSRRSLQCRLGEEGVSFQELEDQVRAALASRYLSDSKIEIAEASFLLGFQRSERVLPRVQPLARHDAGPVAWAGEALARPARASLRCSCSPRGAATMIS
ncbi:MAG: helix-turn-helix transcriptional regulator [Myxococcaceae bacterium]|nr:helix-turn-helix transcriptional regulator [Myxococcaceae bacterium]